MGFGGNMSDQVSLNIKMVATFVYGFSFKPYMESSIRIKNEQFKNDQDGGMQRLLYDSDYLAKNVFDSPQEALSIKSQLESSIIRWVSRIVTIAKSKAD